MIRHVLLVLSVAILGVAPGAEGSTASDVTCRGVPATIVATSGRVAGTPGDDVIVISGTVSAVDAGPGADLICLVGVDDAAIRSDAGDDTVDTTRNGILPSFTTLGSGTNTFFGGPGEDRVDLGGAPESLSSDTVDTGAGDDLVIVNGQSARVAVRTGGGADTLSLSDDLAPGSFNLQGGPNRIEVLLLSLRGGPRRSPSTCRNTQCGSTDRRRCGAVTWRRCSLRRSGSISGGTVARMTSSRMGAA